LDVETGAERDRQSQLVFMLSLDRIEQAARTQRVHLAVKDTFLGLYTEPKFEPRLHVWAEAFILRNGELETEYVNCHPRTGLLPYFESRPVSPGIFQWK
jgi:hypothetical protein